MTSTRMSGPRGPTPELSRRCSGGRFTCTTGSQEIHMRRITFATLIALLFAAFTATSAQAATIVDFSNAPSGAHFAQGASAPVCTYTGATTVSCTGTAIQGVGNTNAVVSLAVTATFTGVCQNPGSKSKVVDPFTE